jgi:pimeloyl-ACP methyl ester carboxylesterase
MPRSRLLRRCSVVCAVVCAVALALAVPASRVVGAQAAPVAASADTSAFATRMIDMGGYRLRVRTAGAAAGGQPTIVFESGLGTPLETWDAVQRDLARETATFVYDRAGIGGSEPGRAAPTLEHIVQELHALLAKAGVRPPYVLVGHSMGGPAIRLFAARHPDEVVGLVYVDPTDFTQTVADQDAIWREIGVPGGRTWFNREMDAYDRKAEMPPAMRAELAAFVPVVTAGFPRHRALRAPVDVPAVVLLAGRYEPWQPDMPLFPGGASKHAAWSQATIRQRVANMTRHVRAGAPDAQGTVVLTPNSGHYVHSAEPELAAWAIRRVLYPDLGLRLARTAVRAGADSALALHAALKASYPKAAFHEMLLNTLGYELLGRGKLPEAIKVFARNVAEYPDASNPHDSLGEAYMAHGDRARAIEHYERSLALDPNNKNAEERLKKLRAP